MFFVAAPQNKVYNDLGQDCVQAGCSVDLYIFNNAFIDLATIGQVARMTGGEVFKYTYFQVRTLDILVIDEFSPLMMLRSAPSKVTCLNSTDFLDKERACWCLTHAQSLSRNTVFFKLQADLDGDRVVADVRTNVRRLCAFDAVMRVRTSAGVRPMDFYGHFFMSNTTDVELAAIDPDKVVILSHHTCFIALDHPNS